MSKKRKAPRKANAYELLKLIPEEKWSDWAEITEVDRYVSRLKGRLMFSLLLYGIIQSRYQSTELLARYYESEAFQVFSGKGAHKTYKSSISARLSTINVAYFETIFTEFAASLNRKYRRKLGKSTLLKYDSTMVRIGANLTQLGMRVGRKPKTAKHKQIKFSIGLKGELPHSVKVFFEQSEISENVALGEAISAVQHQENEIVVFDRGLNERKKLAEFDQAGLSFVTRLKDKLKYEPIRTHKQVKGRKAGKLTLVADQWVYLFAARYKKVETPFRLIQAYNTKTGEPITFLTNIEELSASEIAEIYKQRWDIEVFFRFLKQELGLNSLVSLNKNGIQVMIYMRLIVALLVLVYKEINQEKSLRYAKFEMAQDILFGIMQDFAQIAKKRPEWLEHPPDFNGLLP